VGSAHRSQAYDGGQSPPYGTGPLNFSLQRSIELDQRARNFKLAGLGGCNPPDDVGWLCPGRLRIVDRSPNSRQDPNHDGGATR
jgi:hypothetical protein